MEKTHGCDTLKIDQACLKISSSVNEKLLFYWQSDECENCDLVLRSNKTIHPFGNDSFNLDTRFGSLLKIQGLDLLQNQNCLLPYHFVDTGKYVLTVKENSTNCNVSEDSCLICQMTGIDAPSRLHTYLPIIYAVIGYLAIALAWILFKTFHRKGFFNFLTHRRQTEAALALDDSHRSDDASASTKAQLQPVKKRLKSLDTFRGISIAIMIFVNYGGGKYWFFHHAKWNGLTVGDLVFAWFIWIMGVSMAMSMRSLVKREVPRIKIFQKILKRTVILFSLGIILNTYGANDLSKIRIPGVLQRFAISYFAVATVHMFCAKPMDTHMDSRFSMFRDIWIYWIEWIIMFIFLTLHLIITFFVNEPGCPKGYLGPGGLHNHDRFANCTGGAAGYIDRIFFGRSHIYNHPTSKEIYQSDLPYDPEGILGALTSIFLVFLGLQAGKILLTYKRPKERIIRWIMWSLVTGLIAGILCKFSKNDGWIPVNKNLWSVSYILTTGSMAFFLLCLCFITQDVKTWWSGSPFFYPGMNSILLYVGHQLTGDLFPWSWKTKNTHSEYLGMNLWGCSLWVLISFALYKKKIFLSI